MNDTTNCADWKSHLLPFSRWVGRLKEVGVELLIARAKKQLWDTFERTNLMERLGRDHVFALRTQAFNYAWDKLGDIHAETCPLRVPCPLQPADA